METAGALPSQAAVARPERDWPRMDTPNVLWFFGAYASAFATLELINNVPESHSDVWERLLSLGFYVPSVIVGRMLLRFWWWVTGGPRLTLAVSVVHAARCKGEPMLS